MRRQATTDALTKLPNRVLFFQRLRQELSRAAREEQGLDLMFIDLDGFKQVNDTLGHDAGDLLLMEVARRLTGCVREEDTVCRLAGDEFTIILPHVRSDADTVRLARRLLDALAEPFELLGRVAHISGSIGIATFPGDGKDPETLVKHSDAAMYRAKRGGKGAYMFYADTRHDAVSDHERLRLKLSEAVKHGEFSLLYQPKIDLRTRAVCGMEALLRWTDSDFGAVPPGRFLPILEEEGIIAEVGAWTLKRACQDFKVWSAARPDRDGLSLSVNLSAHQLRQKEFVEVVRRILTETGMPPAALDFELRESFVLTDFDRAGRTVRELSDLGVRFSLDDFGSGNAALGPLRRLPIETVKIDRLSFVTAMMDNEEDRTSVRALLAAGHGLGRRVVAEGVETPAQLALLIEMGCDGVAGASVRRTDGSGTGGRTGGRIRLYGLSLSGRTRRSSAVGPPIGRSRAMPLSSLLAAVPLSRLVLGIGLALLAAQTLAPSTRAADAAQMDPRAQAYILSDAATARMIESATQVDRHLQLICDGPYAVSLRDVSVEAPVVFEDGRADPVAGRWVYHFVATRCARPSGNNLAAFARADGPPVYRSLFPGETLADVATQKRAAEALRTEVQARIGTGCTDMWVEETRVMQPPAPGTAGWREAWTVLACGHRGTFAVGFSPDGRGGTAVAVRGR